ncbi:hypothetical protein [Histophilus somni]|uniref:hypothetical protein n=1 Tax=Histophilus somni TaxID=731 RepID=UPI00201ECE1A|nr:hypothetical protein [Histophilus somni]
MNKLELTPNQAISIDVDGSLSITIKQTDLIPYLEIHNDSDEIEKSVFDNQISLKDKLKNERVNKDELFNHTRDLKSNPSPLEVISNFILDLVDIAHKGKGIKSNSVHIICTLYVNKNSIIDIDCSNAKIVLDNITLEKLTINSSNMKFSGNTYRIQKLRIDSSNFDAELRFDKENNNIKINGSNADLVIHTTDEFDGHIDLDYSSLKTESKAILAKMVNKRSGLLSGDFSNLKLKIYS